MKISTLCLLATAVFALLPASASAGRLDIAVIQYADARDQAEVAAAFAKSNLFEITDSDKVESRDKAIRGGKVLFVQSLSVSPGSSFTNATRLGNQRADVSGSLSGNRMQVEISVQEGIDIGLRKFSRSAYSADGTLSGNTASIIAIKASQGRTATAVKGQQKVVSYNYSTLVVAQYSK